MTVTDQTNTTLEAIARFLEAHDDYAICGHVSPDGDCLGSQLALGRALGALGKRVALILAQPQPIDPGLRFLPGIEAMMPADRYTRTPAVCVAVDTPTADRLGPAAAMFSAAPSKVVIDHHQADVAMADLSYTDPDSPSASMLIWSLIAAWGRDRFSSDDLAAMAECVYTGLVTDTGRFAYQNVTVDAFRAAADMMSCGADPQKVAREVYQNRTLASMKLEAIAFEHLELLAGGSVAISWIDSADLADCGATRSDAEPLIDALRSLGGVRIACLLREKDQQVRGSLRAKDDTDVAAIARTFGGGGHRAAAGFTLKGSIASARPVVDEALIRAVR